MKVGHMISKTPELKMALGCAMGFKKVMEKWSRSPELQMSLESTIEAERFMNHTVHTVGEIMNPILPELDALNKTVATWSQAMDPYISTMKTLEEPLKRFEELAQLTNTMSAPVLPSLSPIHKLTELEDEAVEDITPDIVEPEDKDSDLIKEKRREIIVDDQKISTRHLSITSSGPGTTIHYNHTEIHHVTVGDRSQLGIGNNFEQHMSVSDFKNNIHTEVQNGSILSSDKFEKLDLILERIHEHITQKESMSAKAGKTILDELCQLGGKKLIGAVCRRVTDPVFRANALDFLSGLFA